MAIVVQSQLNVSAQGVPSVQQGNYVDADSFGARSARQIQQAGGMISEYAEARQKQDDLDAITKAEAQLNTFEFQAAHDPENGYFQKQGGNAIGGSKVIMEEYQKRASEIFGEFKTNSQREAFKRLYVQRTDTFSKSVARHEASERNQYSRQLQAAAIETALMNAVADPLNDEYVKAAENRILGFHNANVQGLPAEAVSLAKRKDLSELHLGRIERVIDSNPAQANAIYQANKAMLTPAAASRAEKMVAQGVLDQNAMLKSDEIIMSNEGYGDQIREARKISNAKLRDEVIDRIDKRYAQDERIRKAADESSADDAISLIDRDGGSFDRLPVQLRLSLTEKDSKILKEYSDVKNGIKSLDPVAQLEKYDEIMSVYERSPQALQNYSLSELHANLSGENLDKVLKARRGASDGRSPVKAAERHFGQFVDKAIADNIVNKKDKPVFRLRLEQELSEIEDPTFNDLQSAYDRLTARVVFDPAGFFNKQELYGYEITGEEDRSSIIVPQDERNRIIEAFERKGYGLSEITDEMISDLYAKKQGLK